MKKFLVTILMVGILLGGIMPAQVVDAQQPKIPQCWQKDGYPIPLAVIQTEGGCTARGLYWGTNPPVANFQALGGAAPQQVAATNTQITGNNLWDNIESCNPIEVGPGTLMGCVELVIYFFFVTVPSFLLYFSAYMFDFFTAMTLSDHMYGLASLQSIWQTVRDLANIFFILLLIYAAFQTILGIGHGAGKKTVVWVVVIALVVNFSLFFTKVVIDAGNVMGLIFYNKIKIAHKGPVVNKIYYVGNVERREVAAALIQGFSVNEFFQPETFASVKGVIINSKGDTANVPLPATTLVAMMILYGVIIYLLVYAFAVVGLSFLARTLTLMMLMVVSPFALVSYASPDLQKIKGAGFTDWIHKLVSASFSAVVFMFLLYITATIMQSNVFGNVIGTDGFIERLLAIFVPAILIIAILFAGTKFARSASKEVSEKIIGLGKAAAGIGIGLAAGGTALAGRATIGTFMKGASTGDTAAARLRAEEARRAAGAANWRDVNLTRMQRLGGTLSRFSRIDDLQQHLGRPGGYLAREQHDVAHAAHARHDLDTLANKTTHGTKKKWEDLNGQERYEARLQDTRDRVVRDHAAANAFIIDPLTGQRAMRAVVDPATGVVTQEPIGAFGSRGWDKLTTEERAAIDRSAAVGNDPDHDHPLQSVAGGAQYALWNEATPTDDKIRDSRRKQGLWSNVTLSSVDGSYDVRGLAKVIAKEQSSAFAKIAMGMTGAIAMGMRGALKQIGINHGEPQKSFIKDLGNTITDALKSVKLKVDLSHVGEEKKEDGHGGGGHH